MRKRQRQAVIGLLAALLGGTAAMAVPARAVTGTRLCHGYDDCRAHGYSDHGYEINGGGSYWNMYVGHNCTNYVAFRLVQGGMSNLRPPADPGQSNARLSAYLWGLVYAGSTDRTPKVGSVAWWGSGAAGSIGHVAYVEQVDGDSITVSEDSSSGNDFDWKRITPGQGWPTGFIHFNDGHHVDSPMPAGAGGVPVGGGGTGFGDGAAGRAAGGSAASGAAGGGDVPAAVARGDFGGDVSGDPFDSGAFEGRSFGGENTGSGAWGPMAGNVAPTASTRASAPSAPAAPAAHRKAKTKAKTKAKPSARPAQRASSAPASMFGPAGGGFGPM